MTAPDGIDPQRWETACAAAVAARHNFADTTTCQCGYQPDTAADWQRHQVDAALRAALTELGGETWTEYGQRTGVPDEPPNTWSRDKPPTAWERAALPWLTRTVHATAWRVLPGERERVTAVIGEMRENAGIVSGPLPQWVEAQLPPVNEEEN